MTAQPDVSRRDIEMKLETLKELYVEELKDLYSAENQILKALPQMVKAADSPKLKAGFEEHLNQTREHVSRLEQIFDGLGESPKGKHCKGMEGVLEEGKELLKEDAEPEVLDAGLIAAAQHVEHYEIAGYGVCRTYAKLLGDDKAAKLLQTTLTEEEMTDRKLTQLAETGINVQAM
jgi:ferritin-like metal-binding protein YciE